MTQQVLLCYDENHFRIEMTSNAYGGIRVSNIIKIDAKFLCPVCSIVLYKPHQLDCCGTLVCEGCLVDQ